MIEEAMTLMGRCRLCLQDRALQNSHVIPAFVGRYLVETSATGYLRDAIIPNLRRQGLPTIKLLCTECESRFSVIERKFASDYFPVMQSNNFKSMRYEESFLRFAVSVNWRTLVSKWDEVLADAPHFAEALIITEEDWRSYLMGLKSRPKGEHHLFVFAGIPKSVPQNLHSKFLDYTLRSTDATPALSNSTIAIYSKLVRCIFYSPIIPNTAKGWVNTRIHSGFGRIICPQLIKMAGFSDFLNSRAEEGFSKEISDSQNKKIEQAMLKNPDRVLNSESLKVRLAADLLNHRYAFLIYSTACGQSNTS